MKVRSHHGVRFFTGLALALSLFAQACVAGEVGDEEETEAAAPQNVEDQEAPPAHKERAPAAAVRVQRAAPAATALRGVDLLCHEGRRAHCDPPPNPWRK
jgi:hypothetical protein